MSRSAPATKSKPAAKRARKGTVRHVTYTPVAQEGERVFIKALHGADAFRLMRDLGIVNEKGEPSPAYR